MIFWLVLKREISYRGIKMLKDFWVFFRGYFLKIIFLHGEIFEFP